MIIFRYLTPKVSFFKGILWQGHFICLHVKRPLCTYAGSITSSTLLMSVSSSCNYKQRACEVKSIFDS